MRPREAGEEVDTLLVGVDGADSTTQMEVVVMVEDHKIITNNKAAVVPARAVVGIPKDTIKAMETLIKVDIAAASEIKVIGAVAVSRVKCFFKRF